MNKIISRKYISPILAQLLIFSLFLLKLRKNKIGRWSGGYFRL